MGRPQESIALGSDSLVVQLRGALEVVGEGVVVCDAEGNEVYRNAEASAYSADRHGGVLADQVVTEQLRAALAGDEGEQIVELYGPSRRNLLIRAVTLSGDAGALGAVAVVEDISERRRLEAVRRDFVVNVSHELKTPVGALGLLAETLDGEDDPEVVSRFSSRLAMEAARLAQLIDDLLDLSRLEANETSQREAVDVESVLADAVGPLRVVAAARGIAIHVRCPRGLVLPRDRRDLVSALSNLVDNAIKYSGDHSSVQVSAE
ncbi:MAG: sensor histidine kinase, partial [Acidimicrobiales bacterium]